MEKQKQNIVMRSTAKAKYRAMALDFVEEVVAKSVA
jgi:hypothetical protein